jgi:hypothetical protein
MKQHMTTLLCTLALGLALMPSGCKKSPDKNSAASQLMADGATWGLGNMPGATFTAIKSACDDPGYGADRLNLTRGECYLIMAGSAVRESSWDPYKSCEAWGNPSDVCCGLTQSRKSDTVAVGLNCDPHAHNPGGFKCNILTGLRNLRCQADGGRTCGNWGSNMSLYVGIKKHLGSPNQGALDSYVQDMKEVYLRSDLRSRFGIRSSELRSWDTLLHDPLHKAPPSQSATTLERNTNPKGDGGNSSGTGQLTVCRTRDSDPDGDGWGWEDNKSCKVGPSTSPGTLWRDPYTKYGFPYCSPAVADKDGNGWGWENYKSCKIRSSGFENGIWRDSYTHAQFPYCASAQTDDNGDGWGWENNQSCKVR